MEYEHPVYAECFGEPCKCGDVSSHKVQEWYPETAVARHPFTTYLCCLCFAELFGPSAARWCGVTKIIKQGLPVTPGEVILILRRRNGWTQGELAKRAGVSRALVSRAERDDQMVLLSVLRGIFEALDCGFMITRDNNAILEETKHTRR